MQELKYQDMLDQQKSKQYEISETDQGIKVEVSHNMKNKTILVSAGATFISTSIQGARDLALALRQNANFVEKHQ